MLDEIQKAGKDHNTLVIYSSDNGISFPNGRTNMYEPGKRFHRRRLLKFEIQIDFYVRRSGRPFVRSVAFPPNKAGPDDGRPG